MRNFAFLFIVGLLVFNCQKDKPESNPLPKSSLKITTTDSLIDQIKLTRPLNGVLLFENKFDIIEKDEKGEFAFKFTIETPENASLRIGNKFSRIILLPNQDYQINLTDSKTTYTLDNAKGQELLNSFVRPPLNSFTFINKFNKDSTAQLFSLKVEKLRNEELKKLQDLYDAKEVDEPFYKFLKKDIDYYYAAGKVSVSDYRLESTNELIKNKYDSLIDATVKTFPYKFESTPWNWPEYVLHVKVRRNMYGGFSRERISELYQKDSINYVVIDKMKKNVEEPYREYIWAHYIFNEAIQKQYEKSLITIFDDFKYNYPDSKFNQYLEKEILPIRNYHIKTEYGFSDDVTIIEDPKVNSLTELLSKFKGEKLYIDMWATWCGPCKKEFEYNKDIKDILAENNYKKLFISLDNSEDKDKWEQMIKFYDLAGYHHLASREFFVDFEKNHSTIENAVSIPQYLIVNEEGNIITNNAARPSQPKELEEFIKSMEKIKL
ncbi:redoxin family protein [Winogradskyella echinorum]|uniref:Redoxin family protein n=1 Tax=Winogradskyella echinorum TaxID=538189 RepID=A0ABR6XZB6_9FLAO|nr:redoxin family protein [Winogradskyella echinorum]MBC3845820.1 redoxin family protein [Winogradskyella echinorum]MBC5750168.1 redoxin family protein [Winogradskyella echinorum]